ncbi:cytochrome P450 [Phascolomyces articulosus]|uniref:Cytochrome P450 n=1 Tax=Phascolomyces articulosus TaxID=60185 RepID=A0AAD5KB50_9FUNG|nr:cytochrome P450 [Phascolomyces articulosus]
MDISTISKQLGSSTTEIIKVLFNLKQDDYKKAGASTLIIIAAYVVASKINTAYFGPLANIPGPKAFKFYDMTYSRDFSNPEGTSWRNFKEWQEQYGEVVRLGPSSICVSNKEMLRQVLLKDDLPKGPRYEEFNRISITLFSTTDKSFHKQRRRVLSPAFSVKYINGLEHFMLSTLTCFVNRIDRDIESTRLLVNDNGFGQVDIWKVLAYLALDIIGETAFGETFNMLETNDHFVPHIIASNLKLSSLLGHRPYATMLKILFSFGSIWRANLRLREFMRQIVLRRLDGGEKARRNDILQILIDTQNAKEEQDRMSEEDIAKETVLFLIAGSDTTSNTTGFAVIELLNNPETFAKLRAEIDAIPMRPDQKLLEHEQLKKLPYLNAVINENLRLNPISADLIQRRADKDMLLNRDLFVPKNTVIYSNPYRTHLDPKYWPEPTKFIPERWLEGSDIPADTDAFFPFSVGTRNCIGKGMAMMQMRLSLANLTKFYDFKAIPEEMEKSGERLSFITWTMESDSFKALMKRREA